MDEVEGLRGRVEEVEALVEKLTRTLERQAKTIEKLTAAFDEARRARKRKATPATVRVQNERLAITLTHAGGGLSLRAAGFGQADDFWELTGGVGQAESLVSELARVRRVVGYLIG